MSTDLLVQIYMMYISLTYITVNIELYVGVVRPCNGIGTIGETLEEEPAAQKCDTEIPALPDEAGQEDEEQHHCS